MLCPPSAVKEGRYVVCGHCDVITDVCQKLNQFPSTVIDDDMKILLRFVSEYDRSSTADFVAKIYTTFYANQHDVL